MNEERDQEVALGEAARLMRLVAEIDLDAPTREALAALAAPVEIAAAAFATDRAGYHDSYASAAREIGRLAPAGPAFWPVVRMARETDATLSAGIIALRSLAGLACVLAMRADYVARPDAARTRGEIAALADLATEPVGALFGADALGALLDLTGRAMLDLSRIAASRAPLVRVETGLSLPSTALAFALYGDPERAGELVGRNHAATPLIMAASIEALAL